MVPHNCGNTIIELYSIVYTIHSLKTIRGWNVSRVQMYPPYGQVGTYSVLSTFTQCKIFLKKSEYITIQN